MKKFFENRLWSLFALYWFAPIYVFSQTDPTCGSAEIFIVPTQPNYSYVNYNGGNPGAYRGYYEIRLKPKNPAQAYWKGEGLRFSGQINLGEPGSAIDIAASNDLNQSIPNSTYLQITSSGEVNWTRGNLDEDCPLPSFNIPYISLGFLEPYAVLGIVVVEGCPPKDVIWSSTAAQELICAYCQTAQSVTVKSVPPVSFTPPPPTCITGVIGFEPITISADEKYIAVTLSDAKGSFISAQDGIIRLEPQMNGISDISFIPGTSALLLQGNVVDNFVFDPPVSKNGAFEIYFKTSDNTSSFEVKDSKIVLFYILIGGSWNASQGGKVQCNYLGGRILFSGQTSVCQPSSTSSLIDNPGNSICPNSITLKGSRWDNFQATDPCDFGFDFKINHPNNLAISNLRITIRVEKNSGSAAAMGPLEFINLDPAFASIDPDGSDFLVNYFRPGAFIMGGTASHIRIPLSNPSSCYEAFVFRAEADFGNPLATCAFETELDAGQAYVLSCNSEITGKIVLRDGISSGHSTDVKVVNATTGNTIYTLPTTDCVVGEFSRCADPAFGPFKLKVNKNGGDDSNPTCGVSTFDLVLISKHILGAEPFDSEYKWLAADADANGEVKTSDIVEIRKVILGILPNFTGPSWKYVPSSPTFVFSKELYDAPPPTIPPTPWAPFPFGEAEVQPSISDYGTFRVVKIGDINLNCLACDAFAPNPVEDRSNTIRLSKLTVQKENEVRVRVFSPDRSDLLGLQNAFRPDAARFKFLRFQTNAEAAVYASNLRATESGEIRFSWVTPDAETPIAAETWLFDAVFEKIGETLSEQDAQKAFQIETASIENEAYTTELAILRTDLKDRSGAELLRSALEMRISPNPLESGAAQIRLFSPLAQPGVLKALSPDGRALWASQVELKAGENSFEIPIERLVSGVCTVVFLPFRKGSPLVEKVTVIRR